MAKVESQGDSARMDYVGPTEKVYCCTESCACTVTKARSICLGILFVGMGSSIGSIFGILTQGIMEGRESKGTPWEGIGIGMPSGALTACMLLYCYQKCMARYDARKNASLSHLKVTIADEKGL